MSRSDSLGLAHADLSEGALELVRQGTLHLLGHLAEGRVEAEPCADRDGQQVERVGQLQQDRLLALADASAQPVLGRDEADTGPSEAQHESERQVAADDAEEQEQDACDRARHDHLEAEEVDAAQVVGIARHGQAALGPADLLGAGEALADARQAQGEGPDGALEERLLELQLLERPGLHGAELREARLDRVGVAPADQGEYDEQDAHAGHEREDQGRVHGARPRC
jgi:hypothetical protein